MTYSASDVASAKDDSIDNTEKPVCFAGVENQYFTAFVEPVPPLPARKAAGTAGRWPSCLHKDEKAHPESDVGVEITSKPITIKPDEPVAHTYRVFTGPKTATRPCTPIRRRTLVLPQNRGSRSRPGSPSYVITPTSDFTYNVDRAGLTPLRRDEGELRHRDHPADDPGARLMFPLGRKQALSAQKMQSFSRSSRRFRTNSRTTRKG